MKASKNEDMLDDQRLREFAHDGTIHRKRESKQQQKDVALKAKYNTEIQSQKVKRFANSSFLTPEAAMYLNEAIKANSKRVDDEIVYAGLHGERVDKMKFKRKEKFSSKYTKARGSKRRRKGKFG